MDDKPNQPPEGEVPLPPSYGPPPQPPASPTPPSGGQPPAPGGYQPPPPPSYAPPPPPPSYAPAPPPSPQPQYAPPPPPPGAGGVPGGYAPMQAPGMGMQMGTRYAGFWIRFVAALIDGVIVGIPIAILYLVVAAVGGGGTNSDGTVNAAGSALGGVVRLLGTVVQIGYFIYFWAQGATIGQRALGLKVIDANTGGQITLGKSALRYVGYVVSTFVCFVGLIWAAFDSRKQGWHDKIASTLVVHKS